MRHVVSEDILAMLIQAISVAFFQKVDGFQAFEALVARLQKNSNETVQRRANPSGTLVLRQNTDADLYRQHPISQREDAGGVSGSKTTTDAVYPSNCVLIILI